jgi:hypothetical protein
MEVFVLTIFIHFWIFTIPAQFPHYPIH